MKRPILISLIVALIILIIYLGYWYRYKESMDKVNRNWYEKEYVGKEIKGVLKSITEFNDDPFKIVLGIQNKQDEFKVTYGATCVDKGFRDFVQVGDSVFKTQGKKTIQFCKTNGDCREFELNFCNKFR